MLVVIWNVVLPRGTDVNGTIEGDTRPIVRKGANSLEPRDGPVARLLLSSLWRFAMGKSKSDDILGRFPSHGQNSALSRETTVSR